MRVGLETWRWSAMRAKVQPWRRRLRNWFTVSVECMILVFERSIGRGVGHLRGKGGLKILRRRIRRADGGGRWKGKHRTSNIEHRTLNFEQPARNERLVGFGGWVATAGSLV